MIYHISFIGKYIFNSVSVNYKRYFVEFNKVIMRFFFVLKQMDVRKISNFL